jgi:hypothetical protein
MLLTVKLVLVPSLVVGVTLAVRRWGPRVGGWLTAMPIVSGPALFFLALEQGDAFAAEAARATLVSLIGVAAFAVTYAWIARLTSWPASLLGGWAVVVALTPALHARRWPALAALAAAVAAFAVSPRLLPASPGRPAPAKSPPWDLPLRIAGSLAVVLAVTMLARSLGPGLSGAMAAFPVALTVVLAFAHAQQGAATVAHLLRGFLPAMWAFALFCFVLALAIVPLGGYAAFALGLGLQLAAQAAVFWLLTIR